MVTEEVAAGAGFAERAGALLRGLGPRVAVHLRLPGAPGRRVWELAGTLARAADGTDAWVVVNGRPDVALAVPGVRAVQLGARSLPVAAGRCLVGDRLAVGASVHGSREAVEAARHGADWVLLGTIFPTPSHPGRQGMGPEAVGRCRSALDGPGGPFSRVPVIAIGGIDAANAADVRRAGAGGIAAVRAVWAAEDPVAAALNLLERFRGGASPADVGGCPGGTDAE